MTKRCNDSMEGYNYHVSHVSRAMACQWSRKEFLRYGISAVQSDYRDVFSTIQMQEEESKSLLHDVIKLGSTDAIIILCKMKVLAYFKASLQLLETSMAKRCSVEVEHWNMSIVLYVLNVR